MRHLGSILLSLLLAPLIWALTGIGTTRFSEAYAGGSDRVITAAVAIAALLAAGGAYALLVLPRLAPLGPALAGLILLGATVWPLVDRASFIDTVPGTFIRVEGALRAPAAAGLGLLLAVPLLATLASPRRWRRTVGPDPATHGTVYGSPVDYRPAWAGGNAYQATTPLFPPATTPSSPAPAAPISPVSPVGSPGTVTPPTTVIPPAGTSWPPVSGSDNDPTRRL